MKKSLHGKNIKARWKDKQQTGKICAIPIMYKVLISLLVQERPHIDKKDQSFNKKNVKNITKK